MARATSVLKSTAAEAEEPTAASSSGDLPTHTEGARWYVPITSIAATNVSQRMSTQADLKGLFTAGSHGERRFFLLEFSASLPELGKNHLGTPAVFGSALRAGFSSFETSTEAGGTLAGATANATFSVKKVGANLRAPGFTPAAVGKLEGLFHAGDLSASSLPAIGDGLVEAGDWLVAESKAPSYAPKPLMIAVAQPAPHTALQDAACAAFALRVIEDQKSYLEAKKRLDERRRRGRDSEVLAMVDEALLKVVYNGLGLRAGDEPTDTHETYAEEVLKGRRALMPPVSGTLPPDDLHQAIGVSPYLAKTKEVASLLGYAPADAIRVGASAPTGEPAEPDFNFDSITLDAALSMGFSRVADVSTEANVRLATYWFQYHWDLAGAGGIIAGERWSMGFRAVIKYWGSKLDGELSVPQIAARTSLSHVQSAYELRIFGLDVAELTSLPSFLGATSGPFDQTTYQSLGALGKDVSRAIRKPAARRPCLTEVTLDLTSSHLQKVWKNAASSCFALYHIQKRDVLGELQLDDFDAEVVRNIYDRIVGNTSSKPSSDNASFAKRILNAGK